MLHVRSQKTRDQNVRYDKYKAKYNRFLGNTIYSLQFYLIARFSLQDNEGHDNYAQVM